MVVLVWNWDWDWAATRTKEGRTGRTKARRASVLNIAQHSYKRRGLRVHAVGGRVKLMQPCKQTNNEHTTIYLSYLQLRCSLYLPPLAAGPFSSAYHSQQHPLLASCSPLTTFLHPIFENILSYWLPRNLTGTLFVQLSTGQVAPET